MQGFFQCGTEWPEVPSPTPTEVVTATLDQFVSVLGAERIVKPDDLRGDYPTLQAALQDQGADAFWPSVDEVRGKFFIIGGGTLLVCTTPIVWIVCVLWCHPPEWCSTQLRSLVFIPPSAQKIMLY